MTQQAEPNENAYPIDVEHAGEMTRLLNQDNMLTRNMGGIFPERTPDELTDIHDILDIACGPGGWVQEVAYTYPDKQVTGVDISQAMIEYANAFIQVRHLSNALFRTMNILQAFDFPDNSFDMVNARLLVAVVPRDRWPALIAECYRVLRPGGILRLTETEFDITTSAALETYLALIARMTHRFGMSFSPTGHLISITSKLPSLLRATHFQHVNFRAHAIEYSYGTPAHSSLYQDYKAALALGRAFVLKNANITPQDYDQLCEQVFVEMQNEDFCDLWYLLTVWGYKPV